MLTDRTVHAWQRHGNGQEAEVVYYAKAGRWWHEAQYAPASPMWPLEGRGDIPASRTQLTLSQAVGITLAAVHAEHGEWFPGVPGGRMLDARVRKALMDRRKPR